MSDLFKSREARVAAARARRGTPEWHAGGAELLARRAEAKAAEARAKALARDAAKPVTDGELDRAVKRLEAALDDAAADTGLERDVIAHDIFVNVTLDLRPALVAELRRVWL